VHTIKFEEFLKLPTNAKNMAMLQVMYIGRHTKPDAQRSSTNQLPLPYASGHTLTN